MQNTTIWVIIVLANVAVQFEFMSPMFAPWLNVSDHIQYSDRIFHLFYFNTHFLQ